MGTFSCSVRISNMDGGESREIEAEVDSSAAFTTVPARLLRELGIAPSGRKTFTQADGRWIDRAFGQAWASINGESVVTVVLFGDNNDPALLGAYTLEGLCLAVDPVGQRLVPMEVFRL